MTMAKINANYEALYILDPSLSEEQIAALVACSVLFSWFIDMSSRYSLVYGSLASLIILLVWLYFCGNILLAGAVAGRVWFRRRDGS